MIYETKDLHFAAYLFTKGVDLIEVKRRQTGNKIPAYFVFKDKELCEDLEKIYWNDKDEVVPIKQYIAAIRELRDRTGTMS